MSYNGRVGFGLIGDYDAIADIDVVGEGIGSSLAEYVKLARARSKRRPATRTPA